MRFLVFAPLESIRLDFDDNRDMCLYLKKVGSDNNAGHRTDRNSLKQHRGAHTQPLDGFIEV